MGASTRAYLLLTITALCWGGNAIFGRLAVGEVSPMALVSLRWLGVLALLMVFARREFQRDWPTLRQHLVFVCMLGVLGFTAFNALFYIAAHSTTAVNIGIIQGSVPVFVLIGMFAIYRARITLVQFVGVLVTMLGVAIVASAGDLSRLAALAINFGDLLMVAACLSYAMYAIGLRRRPPVSPLGLFTIMAAVAFVTSLPLTLIEVALDQFQWPTLNGWIITVLVALFPSFVAQLAFMQSVDLIGPSRAGVFVNLVPVFASILAVIFLNEAFELFHALALGLVLGGIWLSEHGKAKTAS